MARDPLQVLLAMRRRSVEQARYALGECLRAEAEVANRLSLLDAATRRNRETSSAWQDAHQFLEMAATQLETTRAKRQLIATEAAAAESRSGEARAVVTAARTAAEAVEQLISERAAAAQAKMSGREQHMLDDITRARRPIRPTRVDS